MKDNEDHLNYLKEYQKTEELAKKAAGCPLPKEAKEILHLNEAQFCKLLEIDSVTYWAWVSGEKEMSINQRIFLNEAIRIAKEKGFI